MTANVPGTGARRGVRQHLPGWIYLAAPLAGALLAVALGWVLGGRPSRAADQATPGSTRAGPRQARVTVTDAQVEAARMILEHDRAAGRETAAAIRKIAEATPVLRQAGCTSRRRSA